MTPKAHTCTVLVILSLSLLLPQGVSAQMCNAEAYNWVDSHRAELPHTYDEISEFPLGYRKAIYSALAAETRAQLWQEQFERFLQSENLAEAQREVLLEAIELATPELFSAMKDRSHRGFVQARQRLAEFEKRARETFGNEVTGDLFGRIGPADIEIGIIKPRGVAKFQSSATLSAGCSCSTVSDYCSSAFHCVSGGCIVIRNECGTFWTYDCNGQCQTNG